MKYIKFSLFLLAAAFIVSSCEKQLQQNDPQSFSDENAFKTIADVQLGVNGAFAGYATDAGDLWKNSLTSDETKIGPDNGGSGALTYRFQYSSDNTSGADVIQGYYGFYSMIDQVNRVLPHIDKVTGGSPERKNELRAHLLGLRALGHFGLLQAFCKNYDPNGLGIAVMTEFDPNAKPARNTMGEVMAQIDADLINARDLLPQTTAANFTDTVFNQVNIAAFQARIALYKRDYDAAISYSTEVINSGMVTLATGSDYQAIWTDDSYSESLFRIRFGTSTGIGGLWTGAGNAAQMSPSDKLTLSYDAADIRLETFIGLNAAGNRYVKKHSVSSRGALRVDLKACRVSEMYLIRAEAYAKKASPDIAAGAADLNLLRSYRIFGYVNENFANSQALVDAVLQERFKELCFEGFRFYDLRRNNLPVERLSTDASPAWQTLPASSHLFVYPIPHDAILGNPNTIQNEGY
jgi:hypothetical protein